MKKIIFLVLVLVVTNNVYALDFPNYNKEKKPESYGNKTPEESAQLLLKRNDRNKDSLISKQEVDLQFRLRRFRHADINQDGFLDEKELVTWFTKTSKVQ